VPVAVVTKPVVVSRLSVEIVQVVVIVYSDCVVVFVLHDYSVKGNFCSKSSACSLVISCGATSSSPSPSRMA